MIPPKSNAPPSQAEVEDLVRLVREGDVSRRRFLALVSAGAGAGALASCGVPAAEDGAGAEAAADEESSARVWAKDPSPFIQHGTNLEARLEAQRGMLTPNDLFFVRSHGPTPVIDSATYRLNVQGDAVPSPAQLTLDELLALPSRTVIANVECAGNWRGFFPTTHGRAATGSQWRTGGVGCAEWVGVPLAVVLEHAGISPDAAFVNLTGLDDAAFERPLPIEKALEQDTILAYAMNGETLPPDHGYPVRAIVPGWVGSNSVKWVGQVTVSAEPIWTRTNTASYVFVGDAWPAESYAPAGGAPVTVQTIKSALALPWPAELPAGRHVIRGFAHSPHAPIARVVWSQDGGTTWQDARIAGPALPAAMTLFEFEWDAPPGEHALLVRATDEAGNKQPDEVPFNELGYLLNVPVPHPVRIA